MASYSCNVQVISRSSGRSAMAAAAYRAGEELKNEWDGKTHDYSHRKDVIYSEILTPENAPEWMYDRNQLWNGVQETEKRKDAQLAREIRFSLPKELNQEQNIQWVREYAKQFVKEGMIADLCIHDKGDGNPHAHMMLTTRTINGEQFGKKCREWNKRENVEQWREQLATLTNRALERYGHPDRVDHRSLKDQGINRTPTIHLGQTAHQLEQEGYRTVQGDRNRAIEAKNRQREQAKRELARLETIITRERQRKMQRSVARKERKFLKPERPAPVGLKDLEQQEKARRIDYWKHQARQVEAERAERKAKLEQAPPSLKEQAEQQATQKVNWKQEAQQLEAEKPDWKTLSEQHEQQKLDWHKLQQKQQAQRPQWSTQAEQKEKKRQKEPEKAPDKPKAFHDLIKEEEAKKQHHERQEQAKNRNPNKDNGIEITR